MIDPDADVMIGPPFGVPVEAAGVTDWGILAMPTRRIAGGRVISTDYTLRCRADLYGALPAGTPITVNGVGYQVRSAGPADDGELAVLVLSKNDA